MSQSAANANAEQTPTWERRQVPAAGISIEVYKRWPLDVAEIANATIVSQRLPNRTGFVFVRYGPDQTIDTLRHFMAVMHTTVTTVDEAETTLAGLPARRATLALRRRGGVAGTDPERRWHQPMARPTTDTVVVTAFQPSSIPILIGYRLKEGVDPADRAIAERIVGSVRVETGDQ